MTGAPGEIPPAIHAPGRLRLTPAGDGERAALSLRRGETSGPWLAAGQPRWLSVQPSIQAGGSRFVLNTELGQVEITLPDQLEQFDLEFAYDARQDRVILKAAHDLEVAGADLAGSLVLLAEDTLTLGPGAYTVAGDFTLLAGQTLRVRDEAAQPLLAQTAGHFTLQGRHAVDIFALHHPGSALVSQGDLVLRSAQPVQGDAHYLAGGQFRVEQLDGRAGDLVSPNDPIILASQNVSLGAYTGASLHVLAGGSVTLDSVTITGNDTAANTINPANGTVFNLSDPIGSLASFNLSDGTPVSVNGSTQPTLDVRAGVAWNTFAGGAPANQVIPGGVITPTFSSPVTSADISVGNITLSPPNGLVLLTNQYRPSASSGSITTGHLNAGTASPGGNGGAILIDSRDHVTAGNLNTAADVAGSAASNGGEVRVLADGNVSHGSVQTYADSGAATAGNGGDVTISAGGTLTATSITSSVDSATGSGNAGSITIAATGPLTLTTINSASRFSGAGFSGDAGDVSILVRNAGSLDGAQGLRLGRVWSDSGAWYYVPAVGPSGDGANISLTAQDGDIVVDEWLWVQTLARGGTNNSGDGGDIALTAANGAISIGGFGLNTRSEVASGSGGNSGQSGDVTLVAEDDIDINVTNTNGGILADTRVLSGTAQGSGTVLVQSNSGSIDFGLNGITVQSFSNGGQAGSTGGITLEAAGDVNVRFLNARSQTSGGGGAAGDGGPVMVTGGGSVELPNGINSASEASAGTAGNGGSVTLTAGGTLSGTSINSYVQSATGSGNAGDISITATGPLTLTTISSHSRFTGAGFSGDAGDVSILVRNAGPLDGGDDLRLTYIWSDSGAWYYGGAVGPSGNGANVSLVTEDGDVMFSEWLWVQTLARGGAHNSGNGGNVAITATNGGFSVYDFGINTRSQVASGSSGIAGKAGDVTIAAAGTITNPTFGGIDARSFALSGASLGGGAIRLQSTGGDIDFGANDLSALSSVTSGQAGSGGSISLEAAGSITAGHLLSLSESATGSAGDAGAIELTADGGIAAASLNATALGGAGDGAGGTIRVESSQFVRLTGTTPFSASVAAQGLPNSSAITITHGGAGVTPFIVGDAAVNGAAYAVTTGDAQLDPVQPYFYSHFEAPNLWINSVPSPLSLSKQAAPGIDAPYHGAITYTLVLSNSSGALFSGVLLTDTLPAAVSFDHWVAQPAGAVVAAGQLTWTGTVPASGQVLFSFVVNHTGNYGDAVTNTAEFFHPASGSQGSAEASFGVVPAAYIYVPMIMK